MANRWSLRKTLLASLIGALSLSALVGIYIFVVGDFGETEIKILVTTLSLAYFSVCALGCSVALERGRTRWLTFPGLASCAFGFLWSLFMIWSKGPHYDPAEKTMVIAVIAAFSLAQSCLLTLASLRGNLRWVFGATLAAIFALAVLVSLMVIFEWDDELLFRLAGVLGILDAAGTLAVPILYKLGPTRHPAPLPLGQAEPSERWHIELACPRCGHRGRYPVGPIRCPGCSLQIQVGVVEPAEDTTRPRFQFSLRSILLLMLLVSLPLGWIGFRLRERARQAQAVAALKEHGANVYSRYGNVRSVTFSYRNQFDAAVLAQLKKLPHLESLELRSMPVSDGDLRYLEHLELTSLGLAYTEVTDAGLNSVATLTELRGLDLRGTRVTDAGLNSLATLRQLRWLKVEGTRITPPGIQRLTTAIQGLHVNTGVPMPPVIAPTQGVALLKERGAIVYSLRNGDVPAVVFSDRDRFDPSTLAQLNNLRRLEWVELRRMPVSDQDLRHLEHLRLTGLGLAYTEVTDAGLSSLARLTELQHLDLQGTRVTDAALNSLVRLRQLRHLDLRGTAVTRQGVERLTEAIPGLHVNSRPPERLNESHEEACN